MRIKQTAPINPGLGMRVLGVKLAREKFLVAETIAKNFQGTSLLAQWLRVRLPMQGTWVRALVQEDPTCHGATKPVRHNYLICALEPVSHNY